MISALFTLRDVPLAEAAGLVSGLLVAVLAIAHPRAALEHPTRRRIYDHLLQLPGDHFRSIVRSLRLGLGTARHHLDVLATHGWVRAQKLQGRVRYYASGKEALPQMNRLYERHWTLRELRMRVLLTVVRHGEVRPNQVARHLRISRQLAAYHLARLRETGHVTGSGGVYRATTSIEGLAKQRP